MIRQNEVIVLTKHRFSYIDK